MPIPAASRLLVRDVAMAEKTASPRAPPIVGARFSAIARADPPPLSPALLSRDGRLLAYGTIVTSSDSQQEGARTAAATTLSQSAEIVLKVSVDGDITVLRAGGVIATLLG